MIVTTPQKAAVSVARRGISFYTKEGQGGAGDEGGVELLGIVETMSGFKCPCCGVKTNVYGAGGGGGLADEAGLPLLCTLPGDVGSRPRQVTRLVDVVEADSESDGTIDHAHPLVLNHADTAIQALRDSVVVPHILPRLLRLYETEESQSGRAGAT